MLRVSKVLVTGGATGIGFAVSKRLIQEGAQVVLAGRRENKLAAAQQELGENCRGCIVWDIAQPQNNREKLAQASAMMGGLDGLVNAAGVSSEAFGKGYDPWDITPDEWDLVMDTNLKGTFFMLRDFTERMRETGTKKANILNISSNAACMDITGPYGASKLALTRMTRALAKRIGRDGIIMNGIAPGCTYTDMIAAWAKSPDNELPRSVLNRFTTPEEMANLAAYLMSEEGVMVCGHTVVADAADNNAVL